jgi:hypothetical protein
MSYKVKILNGVLKLKTFSDVVLNILGIKDLGTQTGEVTSGYIDWSMQQYTQTTAQWNASTYILLKGQVGVEDTGTTTFKLKVGDGVSTWQQLGYISGGGANDYPENLFLTVVNKTGDNLLATGYKVLKVQDAQGQRLAVDYALADSNGNSTDTIGIVYENINNNQSGRIVVIGELTGLNTTGSLQGETWNDGDVLYLSSSTPGNLTKVQPIAPNHLVVVGYVVYAHANQGKIYCKVQNGWELGELHDVYAPSPSNNNGIFWNSTTTRYENKSIASALGYTPENSANKGVANGYASLDSSGKVPSSQLNLFNFYFLTAASINLADATSYYIAYTYESPSTTEAFRQFNFDASETIKELYLTSFHAAAGTSENVTIYIRNVTTATDYLVGTYKEDFTLNSSKTFSFTGLNIAVNSADFWTVKILTPTWVTNPVAVRYAVKVKTL